MGSRLEKLWRAERTNEFMLADATQLDYEALLIARGFPERLGYLSLDIDDATTAALQRIDFDKRSFDVITSEHCVCNGSDAQQKQQRKFFSERGYVLACADVSHKGGRFEDWWVHPDVFDKNLHPVLDGVDCEEIVKLYEVSRAERAAQRILDSI